MKRIILICGLLSLFAGSARAQTTSHSNAFTWTASTSAGIVGYNVYKFAGACSPTAAFTKLTATPQTALSFTDSGMADGAVNCYYVTAVNSSGLESITSGTIQCNTPIFTADAHPLPPGKPVPTVQ